MHDTWSSWQPLFVAGPAYAEFGADLHRHGLEYANCAGPMTATVSDDPPPLERLRGFVTRDR